jgi:hypothetical protein
MITHDETESPVREPCPSGLVDAIAVGLHVIFDGHRSDVFASVANDQLLAGDPKNPRDPRNETRMPKFTRF